MVWGGWCEVFVVTAAGDADQRAAWWLSALTGAEVVGFLSKFCQKVFKLSIKSLKLCWLLKDLVLQPPEGICFTWKKMREQGVTWELIKTLHIPKHPLTGPELWMMTQRSLPLCFFCKLDVTHDPYCVIWTLCLWNLWPRKKTLPDLYFWQGAECQ